MKNLLIISTLLLLSACTKPALPTPAPVENTPTPAPVTEQKSDESMPKNAVVSLNYTLREATADGKILETTVESVAKENGLYQTGMTFEPFKVVLGTSSVIPGFENGVAGMKKGEKKMIEVAPKDGYGEAMVVRPVQKYEIAPEFTITVDKTRFQDVVTQTVSKASLGEAANDLKEGQSLTGGLDIVAKVVKIDGDNITLDIENKDHPFYGKQLAVGATAEKDGATFNVKELTETGVTLDVKNNKSPFAGKKFEVGAVGTIENPNASGSAVTFKVVGMNGDMIDVEMPNTHPLAGKTLFFDVEVLDIE